MRKILSQKPPRIDSKVKMCYIIPTVDAVKLCVEQSLMGGSGEDGDKEEGGNDFWG